MLLISSFLTANAFDIMSGPQVPTSLRCEYLEDPMGIDVKQPRFSWVLEHTQRGQRQSAFHLIVSSESPADTGDMWDSGKINSDQSTHVVYLGKPLESGRSYYWKVCYWDKDDTPSPYSEVARFDTGLFSLEDWEGKWIGGGNQLRKEFDLDDNPIRALAYISGLGYYELRLNGQKVGNNVLDPGWTSYDKRVLYSTYDVKNLLHKGSNAVGVMMGEGWYGAHSLLLQINIEFEHGGKVSVKSDSSWKGSEGPIISDSIYNGEIYDARKETPGWDLPEFDDSSWSPVELAIAPKGELSAQMMPPIQVVDTIVPRNMTNPKPAIYVFDMGQNFSGWTQLRVCGPRGTVVCLRYSELLYEDGMINTENLRSARAEDIYTLRGDKEEIYEPRFTYHGFRYVELTGFPGVPNAQTLRGRVVHSSVKHIGSFSCSKPILNQLQHIIIWGQKTNLHSIPTDCNQRDERMGWLGDVHLTVEEAMMNFDMGAFYTNFIRNIRDVQDKEGSITDTVPYIWGQRPADPAWGTAYPLLCWYMYQYYGDKRILEEHFEGVKNYVEFLHKRAKDGLVKYSHYGDWVAIDKTPGSLVSSFYYYYDVKILSDIAEILGKSKEAKTYKQLAEKIKKEFQKQYYNSATKNYRSGTQTANTLPLFLDLVPEPDRGAVIQNLIQDILYKNNSHLTTGIIGTKYIMEVLTRMNHSRLAYDLAIQTTYPSWGYMIANNATTLWELWQNKTGPGMNSHNHPMFGSVGAWFYKALAGINLVQDLAGFRKIRFQPQMIRDLHYCAGSIHTLRGTITSSWTRSDKSIRLNVTIPVNSEAEIILPKFNLFNIVLKESGTQIYTNQKFLTSIPGIRMVEEAKSFIIIEVGSGQYSFELTSSK